MALLPSFDKIVVRMPNWLGDLVMATPLLADLKRAYPKAAITAMCQAHTAHLLENHPAVDGFLPFQKPSGYNRRSQQQDIIAELVKGQYDLGLLTTNSFSSAWWFWRGKIARRIGFAANLRSFLLTDAVPFPKDREAQHLVRTYKHLLSPLRLAISDTAPQLYVTEAERLEARATLRLQGVVDGAIVVGINPGAAYGSAKCWLPERFRELTSKLLQDPRIFVVYFGDAKTEQVVNQITHLLPPRVINLANATSLRQLMGLIGCCDLFLTNDSGPMHIAAALHVPVLALFGSTNDAVTGPYKGGLVIHKRVACSPCYQRVCPIDFKCMRQITVAEVYDQIRTLLESPYHG